MDLTFLSGPDGDFAYRAKCFAGAIAFDPGRFNLTPKIAAKISAAVEEFESAYDATWRPGMRSSAAREWKTDARKRAEALVKQYVEQIEADDTIHPDDKLLLRTNPAKLAKSGKAPYPKPKLGQPVKMPAKYEQKSAPPQTNWRVQSGPWIPPVLTFERITDETDRGGAGKHVLTFRNQQEPLRNLPRGTSRLELFADLIPATGKPPAAPGEATDGRSWYVRSFTSGPIIIAPPAKPTGKATRLAYWARWATANGEVGAWSEAAVVVTTNGAAVPQSEQKTSARKADGNRAKRGGRR